MSRYLRLLCVVLFFTVSLWHFGSGIWIFAKAIVAQRLIEHAWHNQRQMGGNIQPWPWADTHPIARLIFPQSGKDLFVLEGASSRNLAFGPALVSGSSFPGDAGNSVIVGHRDTHFSILEELASGQLLIVEDAAGNRLRYRITATLTTHESQTQYLMPTAIGRLTLITCYPFDALVPGGPLRYLVIATRTDTADTVNRRPGSHRSLLATPAAG